MSQKRTYQFNESRLTIQFGDLTTSDAQALVSSDDYYLTMGGGVSASILRVGGNAIALDAAKKVPANLGDVVVTTAGSLSARYIFHAVTIGPYGSELTSKGIINQVTNRCLLLLDTLHLTSIAFPSIGTGAARFRSEDVAVQMAEVISEYLKKRQTCIEVTLYLFERSRRAIDYTRFFEEFAMRVPRLSEHAVDDISEDRVDESQPAQVVTEAEISMHRLNNLRKLIALSEDKRYEIEVHLIKLISDGQEGEITKQRRRLEENQEIRLDLLDELATLSHSIAKKAGRPLIPDSEVREPVVEVEKYIDFDLHISPEGHVIARSKGLAAKSNISLQPPNDIGLALQLIEHQQTNADLLKQVGQSLYDWLFAGEIHTLFHQAETWAKLEEAKLRIRLQIEAATIASLPIELLYREKADYFLATNPATVLSRYLNLSLPSEQIRRKSEEPLHMLLIIADPIDQTSLEPHEWEIIIRDALAKPLAAGHMTLQVVEKATRKGIRDALLAQKPHIIQFVGHGIYQNAEGHLALVDEKNNKTWLVNEAEFANLFLGFNDNLGLICLATCESAQTDDPQAFLGIAPKLVQRGVPAVIAMQYALYIKTGKIFLEDFYTSLSARKPIDWSIQAARNAISLELGLDNREFATPVLYMRAKDGTIFEN